MTRILCAHNDKDFMRPYFINGDIFLHTTDIQLHNDWLILLNNCIFSQYGADKEHFKANLKKI